MHSIESCELLSDECMTPDYPRCKTCKHWDVEPAWQNLGGSYSIARRCLNPKIDNGLDELDGVKVSGMDPGHFDTGPDFGCIHHEEK